jgi:four helix bundle protein
MNKSSIISVKTYAFALRIIKLYQYLIKEHGEYNLSKQILRSGTSIGANVEEASGAQSPKDFIAKLSISYKEARETHYWLRLLKDSGYLDERLASSMLKDGEEILKILTKILITSKQKAKNK